MVLLCMCLIYHPILIICGPIIPSRLWEKLHNYLDGGSSALCAELVHFFLSSLPLYYILCRQFLLLFNGSTPLFMELKTRLLFSLHNVLWVLLLWNYVISYLLCMLRFSKSDVKDMKINMAITAAFVSVINGGQFVKYIYIG